MSRLLQGRTLARLAVVLPLLALFAYVALRSGPLAPVAVTLATVESASITPSRFGIGTVEARFSYRIGPTQAGRLQRLAVHVGDRVEAGQLLGQMDPVDLDDRIRAQEAASRRAEAAQREAAARHAYAASQAQRYERLFAARQISEEALTSKRQELQIALASRDAAREELARIRFERAALEAQRDNLRLVAPVAGVVVRRDAEPGTTVVAGQTVVELVDPESLWVNARFDQVSAAGLSAGLPARIVLRSRPEQVLNGRVLRLEPVADAVTEELLAKVAFEPRPDALPPLGELAEVTVVLPALPAAAVVSNAALRRDGGRLGVWQLDDGATRFTPVTLGAADLDGRVQVRAGLAPGARVVLYSDQALKTHSRIRVVEELPGSAR